LCFYTANDIPTGIKQALTTRKVIGIGGVHNYSLGRQLHMKTYDMASLRKFTAAQVWKGDSELQGEYRDTDISNLLLVQGFMEALHIPAVTVVKRTSCRDYWCSSEIRSLYTILCQCLLSSDRSGGHRTR
jgi:exopolyphosphatase/guanosine-5'-triphosphate,3'-diphosphate pyrophosphatase